MPPPPPLTVLSAWEGCAPEAQLAAVAPRVQEQAGQYGLHTLSGSHTHLFSLCSRALRGREVKLEDP
jgi:hypothetical protein